MKDLLLVMAGGALGSALRYCISLWLPPAPGAAFPLSTFLVNGLGSLVIGLLAGVAAREGGWMSVGGPLLATGVCGGFTTFSAFSLDGVRLMQSGHPVSAALYLGGSVLAGLALCALGMRLSA